MCFIPSGNLGQWLTLSRLSTQTAQPQSSSIRPQRSPRNEADRVHLFHSSTLLAILLRRCWQMSFVQGKRVRFVDVLATPLADRERVSSCTRSPSGSSSLTHITVRGTIPFGRTTRKQNGQKVKRRPLLGRVSTEFSRPATQRRGRGWGPNICSLRYYGRGT